MSLACSKEMLPFLGTSPLALVPDTEEIGVEANAQVVWDTVIFA